MRILISGLTAAGKTTHARLLARALGLPCFNAGQHLADLHPSERHRWTPAIDDARSDNMSLDRAIDAMVLDYMNRTADCVVDAWAAPWFPLEFPALRIWLESDVHSRTFKAQVTEARAGLRASYESQNKVVTRKDQFSRDRFLEMHRFDLATDREPFDIILDNSALITEATVAASNRGIAAFAPVVLAATIRVMGRDSVRGAEEPSLTASQEQLIVRCA